MALRMSTLNEVWLVPCRPIEEDDAKWPNSCIRLEIIWALLVQADLRTRHIDATTTLILRFLVKSFETQHWRTRSDCTAQDACQDPSVALRVYE